MSNTEAIIAALAQGMKPVRVAELVGVSKQRVSQVRHRHFGNKSWERDCIPVLTRFMRNVYCTRTCWFWIGWVDRWGYGQLTVDGRPQAAHRISYRLFIDPSLPDAMRLLHRCDTPQCVHPNHLRAGSIKDNVHDAVYKGSAVGHHDLAVFFNSESPQAA